MKNKVKTTKGILKGFTLIELLVVIAIIALLSTLAVVSLNNARTKARDAKRVSDIKQMQTALELYFSDQQSYPAVPSAGVTLGTGGGTGGATSTSDLTCLNNAAAGWVNSASCTGTVYMGQVPATQQPNGTAYVYKSFDSTGTGACTSSPCPTYNLTFGLEGQTGTLPPGAHTATPPTGIQ